MYMLFELVFDVDNLHTVGAGLGSAVAVGSATSPDSGRGVITTSVRAFSARSFAAERSFFVYVFIRDLLGAVSTDPLNISLSSSSSFSVEGLSGA